MKTLSKAVQQCESVGNTRPIRPMIRGTDRMPKFTIGPEGDRYSGRFVSLRERIERYVDTCPEAISGQEGHKAAFKVAIALIRGFDLSEAQALDFLRRYNQVFRAPTSLLCMTIVRYRPTRRIQALTLANQEKRSSSS
jgi:hypothetical protein